MTGVFPLWPSSGSSGRDSLRHIHRPHGAEELHDGRGALPGHARVHPGPVHPWHVRTSLGVSVGTSHLAARRVVLSARARSRGDERRGWRHHRSAISVLNHGRRVRWGWLDVIDAAGKGDRARCEQYGAAVHGRGCCRGRASKRPSARRPRCPASSGIATASTPPSTPAAPRSPRSGSTPRRAPRAGRRASGRGSAPSGARSIR